MIILMRLTKPGLTRIWHIWSKLNIGQCFPSKSHIEMYQLGINDLINHICSCLEKHNTFMNVEPYICSALGFLFRSFEKILSPSNIKWYVNGLITTT